MTESDESEDIVFMAPTCRNFFCLKLNSEDLGSSGSSFTVFYVTDHSWTKDRAATVEEERYWSVPPSPLWSPEDLETKGLN